MGQSTRTTKLLLDLSPRDQAGMNSRKRAYLEETVKILDAGRRFYLGFFLAHPKILMERVEVISQKTGEVKEALISADKLLSLSRNFRRSQPTPIPTHSPRGTSASGSPTSQIATAVRSSKIALAKPEAISAPCPPGNVQAREKGNQAFRLRPTIPPSTPGHLHWNWRPWTCARVFCA